MAPRRRALSGLVVVLALAACVHTRPFRDASGRVVPGSVASMERLEIGGVAQQVWIRGRSTDAPALVLLHGGPGASESALFRHYDSALEESFLVVYWEQRGAGRSYHSDIPPESMTIARFVADLELLVEWVCRRYGKEKVALLAHSWGTIIGALYAAEHPEKVSAYAGVAQIVNMPEGERLSWEFALARARERGDEAAAEELEEIGPPPHSVDEMLVSRKWVERFGGSFHAELSTGALIWAALATDEANLVDLVKFGRGNRFSLEHLWPEQSRFVLDARHRHFDVPMLLMLGRHDWQVPAVLAERWFAEIEAPAKRLVWFEGSAHNPPFEEPDAFVRIVRDTLLAWSDSGAQPAPSSPPGNG